MRAGHKTWQRSTRGFGVLLLERQSAEASFFKFSELMIFFFWSDFDVGL